MTNACATQVPEQLELAVDEAALDELVAEIATYLAAVAAFREEGCEPAWHPEDRPIDARVRVRRRR